MGFRVAQWNLLATGLHQDGFVKAGMFDGEDEDFSLLEFIALCRDYKEWMFSEQGEGFRVGENFLKPLQNVLNQWLFSELVPVEVVARRVDKLLTGELFESEEGDSFERLRAFFRAYERDEGLSEDLIDTAIVAMRAAQKDEDPIKVLSHALTFYQEKGLLARQKLLLYRSAYAKSEESTTERNASMLRLLKEHYDSPDILIVQECAPDQLLALLGSMPLRAEGGAQEKLFSLISSRPVWSLDQLTELQDECRYLPYVPLKTGPSLNGFAILINESRFTLQSVQRIEAREDKRKALALMVVVQCVETGHEFSVLTAHLKSGDSEKDGETREKQIAEITAGLALEERPIIFGFDGNCDSTLETAKGWDKLDDAGFVNYTELDKKLKENSHTSHLVTVNKIRGMFSAQVSKWGSYELRNIDYLMLRSNSEPNGLAMKQVVNREEDRQLYCIKILKEICASKTCIQDVLRLNEKANFLGKTMPSIENPSDHAPIVAEFEFTK